MGLNDQQYLHQKLKDVFGYDCFRIGQLEVIQHLLSGQDVLSVMPTGAGKSLCFQLPAVISEFKTIVICPIIALMNDQVSALKQLGVEGDAIHSGKSYAENVAIWRNFTKGLVKILYISPERLMTDRMLAALKMQNIGMFVIDEAHCISKWGPSFRPDYEALSDMKKHFPNAAIAAFTATADHATRIDINQKLMLGGGRIFLKGFDRPNLFLSVRPKQNIKASLVDYTKKNAGYCGIIYCLSRKEVDNTADALKTEGINAIAYHAGKPSDVRDTAYNRFMTEENAVMVATIAFGMGIDKPDIRFVIHANLPVNVESFYQEIGRAGRDGLPADTILFHDLSDIIKRRRMIFDGGGSQEFKVLEYKRLESLIGYCETIKCRKQTLLAYFDEDSAPCGNCDNCLTPPKKEDYTDQSKMLMAAIKQTGQFFGISHIIDVVRGAEVAKIKTKRHDSLDSFGKGSALSKPFLQSLIRQLVAASILKINLDKYGALQLTEKAEAMITGNEKFFGRLEAENSKPLRKSKQSSPAPELHGNDASLYQALKALRLDIARKKNIPAYVIFYDTTLQEMVAQKPIAEAEFLQISGVTRKKLDAYFKPFADVISRFMA